MIMLYVQAPFAAFRPLTAGTFRQSLPFITPTAAYGLLLHLAGIETRRFVPGLAATGTTSGLPMCEIALGVRAALPVASRLLHQLHNYPVGNNTGKENEARTWGAKHNIQPVAREVLHGLRGFIGLRGDTSLEQRLREGLARGLDMPLLDGGPRYGIPFLGDNSFMLDIVREIGGDTETEQPPRWYCPRAANHGNLGGADICRMPVWINRNDMSRTRTRLFSLTEPHHAPPPHAWIPMTPEAD